MEYDPYRMARRLSSDQILDIAEELSELISTYERLVWKIAIACFFSGIIGCLFFLVLTRRETVLTPIGTAASITGTWAIGFLLTRKTRVAIPQRISELKAQNNERFWEALEFVQKNEGRSFMFVCFNRWWKNLEKEYKNRQTISA